MTLQVLKYFTAVAHYRSYTRAAQECFVTQPALSRAIAALEQELGCRLFERNTKRVVLTEVGKACLQDAQEILAKCEQMKLRARSAETLKYNLAVGYLHIGYLSYLSNILMEQGSQFRITTEYGSFGNLRQKLMDGKLDILLAPQVNCDGVPGLHYVYVERSQLCVVLHNTHPLAGEHTLTMKDISGQCFIAWDEEELPGANRAHCSACQENGFTPNYIATGKKLGDVLMLVQQYQAVALISQNIQYTMPKDFRVIPLQDSRDRYGLVCAWREGNHISALERLEQVLLENASMSELIT